MNEFYVFWFGVKIVGEVGVRWWRLLSGRRSRSTSHGVVRRLLLILPVVLLGALTLALRAFAAREVREQGGYLQFFVFLGLIWLVATLKALAWLGISLVDDVVERENTAAGCAVGGAMIAGTICYAFSNFGEGETIWTTLGPAALGFVACMALWAAYQRLSGASDAIAIDRDLLSGLRFAGMAIGSSLIIGRAMAGDYVSVEATFRDLWQQGWPALALVAP